MIYKWWKFFFLFYFIIFKIIAQTDTITLPTTEIKAPKSYDSITYSIKTIQIISKEDIEKAPIYHINDLLDYSQSIDMRERGTMGIQGDISIRGGSFEQTIIMLNGFIMNNPQTGHHSLDIPINIDNIEKIEIINNSLARAYGVNAYAGAINIITKPSKTNKLQISAAGGEYGWYSGKISLSLNKNKTKNLISLSNMSSDGYIKNTDFDYKNIYTQNNISFNKFNLNIETGISDKNFGANSFYTAKYPDQFEHTLSLFIQSVLKYSSKNFTLNISPYCRRHQDRFELFRNNYPSWYLNHNYHLTYVKGFKIITQYKYAYGNTTLGSDYKNEVINSNVLGMPTGDTIKALFEKNGFYTKYNKRDFISLFANHQLSIKNKIIISGGMIILYNNHYKSLINPGIDLTYVIKSNLNIGLAYNHASRIPSFTDLFYSGPVNIGNPDLKAEKSKNYEIICNWNKNNSIKIKSTIYYRQGKNLIDWIRLADTLPWKSANITKMNTIGFEFSTTLILPFLLNKNNFFIKNITANYSYIDSDKSSKNWISYYILDYLKHKINLQIEYKLTNKLYGLFIANYQDRAGCYTDFFSGVEIKYKPFCIISNRLNYEYKLFNFYADISNITNSKYVDFGNIIQPGRWIKFGIILNLNL